MSKRLVSRLLGMFQSRTQVGVDKAGNRYFSRVEEVDGATNLVVVAFSCHSLRRNTGAVKERRWVEFKGAEQDSTTVPGYLTSPPGPFVRKKAPGPEELAELEARRERVRKNIERMYLMFSTCKITYAFIILKKKEEEEERKAGVRPVKKIGKSESPNLQSFVKQQFPGTPDQQKAPEEVSRPKDATDTEDSTTDNERYSEPTGTGATFKPGTWQPPT
nr:unnamed protein product [Digitaria exilis]